MAPAYPGTSMVTVATTPSNPASLPAMAPMESNVADYASTLARLDIVNTTISGNRGVGVRNSIVNTYSGQVYSRIQHATVADNDGGGVVASYSAVELENSIVAGNGLNSDLISSDTGSFSIGYSLIQDPGSVTITEPVPNSNIFGEDPLLGPLQNNGGPTETHALLPDSPAIDAGDPELCSAARLRPARRGFIACATGAST